METGTRAAALPQERLLHYDLLRILAMLGVVVIHVVLPIVPKGPGAVENWAIYTAFDSAFRFCVPVFVMLSGAMMLGREKYTVRYLLTHNILRLVTAFLFWSVLSATYFALRRHGLSDPGVLIREIIGQSILGHGYYWFLLMIAGLYLIIPLLNRIVADRRLTLWFLLLALVFEGGFRTLELVPKVNTYAALISSNINLSYVRGYTGYFVAGYYLHTYGVERKWRRVLYALGLVSLLCIGIGTQILSVRRGEFSGQLYGYLRPGVCFVAVAVFLLFQTQASRIRWNARQARIITALSGLTLGAYLSHAIVLDLMERAGLTALAFHPLLSVPALSLLALALSFGLCWVLGRIPFLKRHIL